MRSSSRAYALNSVLTTFQMLIVSKLDVHNETKVSQLPALTNPSIVHIQYRKSLHNTASSSQTLRDDHPDSYLGKTRLGKCCFWVFLPYDHSDFILCLSLVPSLLLATEQNRPIDLPCTHDAAKWGRSNFLKLAAPFIYQCTPKLGCAERCDSCFPFSHWVWGRERRSGPQVFPPCPWTQCFQMTIPQKMITGW